MKFNSRGYVSIAELVVYFPSLVIAVIICSRHGFSRSSGWIYTLILCLVRIIGACCQIATYHDQSTGLLETAFILDSVGISPLLFATLGLLSRCVDTIKVDTPNTRHMILFRVTQLVVTLGLVLSVVGGTSSVSSTGTFTVQTTSKVGVLLYVLAYASIAAITIFTIPKLANTVLGEKRLVLAVIIALPFIAVRIAYSTLAVFLHNHDFSILNGSVIIMAVMAVLEEFVVVIIYLIVGWMAEKLPATERGPLTSRPWKGPLGPTQNGGGGQRRGMRQGPIHSLVGMAVAAASDRPRGEDLERGRH